MTSPNTGGRRRVAVHEVPQLFSSPYWYEGFFQLPSDTYRLEIPQQDAFVMVGTPYLTLLPVELTARLSSAVGTTIVSHWIAATGVVIDLEPIAGYAGIGAPAPADETPSAEGRTKSKTPAAAAAQEIRQLSCLSIDQLAALFPDRRAGGTGRMSRENYHRWLSGRTDPSDANLQRLLGLRHLLREVAARVDDVRSWLIAPSATLDFDAPYALLRRGALTRLWTSVSQLPVRHAHGIVVAPDGDRGVRIKESLRSSDTDTPTDEFDDASEWFEG